MKEPTHHTITAEIPVLVGAKVCQQTAIVKVEISYDYRPPQTAIGAFPEAAKVDFAGVVLIEVSDLLLPPTEEELTAMAKKWLDDHHYEACTRAEQERSGGWE